MPFYQFQKQQKINTNIDEIWNFIPPPAKLKQITPDYMGFDITSKSPAEKMYAGMIISYTVSPILGLKTTWVTEITHIVEKKYFIDNTHLNSEGNELVSNIIFEKIKSLEQTK